MQWFLFAADSIPNPGTYHNSIDGEIITAVVCITFSLIVLWVAYRNFIRGISTADGVRETLPCRGWGGLGVVSRSASTSRSSCCSYFWSSPA